MHVTDNHPMTLVDLLRHGLPVGGARYRGSLDDPLSAEGWEEMRRAVGDHAPWTRVVSSPLARCRAFAEELAARHRLPLAIDAGFREIGFGDWEGRSVTEILEREAEALGRYWQDPVRHTPPQGEPLAEFCTRVARAWDAVVEGSEGEHLLLIAHGGVVRAVLAHVLEMPIRHVLRLEVPNASISRIRVQPDVNGRPHPSLVFHSGSLGTTGTEAHRDRA